MRLSQNGASEQTKCGVSHAPKEASRMLKSPLKTGPFRNPGQSLDEELANLLDDRAIPYFVSASALRVNLRRHDGRPPWHDAPRDDHRHD